MALAAERRKGFVMAMLMAVLFAALEYAISSSIGLPEYVGAVAAIQVGALAAMLVWLGGIPLSGRGLGRRW
jgi:hypothetical protein